MIKKTLCVLIVGLTSHFQLYAQIAFNYVTPSEPGVPVSYISTSLDEGSSNSHIVGIITVFKNISDRPITAIGISCSLYDSSGHTYSNSTAADNTFPFGETKLAYLPGALIELKIPGTIVPAAPVERVDVKVNFVEIGDKVWPDKSSEEFRDVFQMRRGWSQMRRYYIGEYQIGGIERIRALIEEDKSRLASR